MNVTLRRGRPEDAEACGTICYAAFNGINARHNFPPDFPSIDAPIGLMHSMLGRPDVYSIVAEAGGRIVGSNFLWETSNIVGIGPITVDAEAQDGTIGRQLMEAALARSREQRHAGVRLVQATFHNRSLALYAKLGFVVREALSTMQGPALQIEIPGHKVRLAREEDVAACNQLCLRVHGHDRATDVFNAVREGSATVVEHDGRITGYATLVGFFGHAVAEGNEDLKALIGAAEQFPGPGFILPTRNAELFRWCLEHGLRVVHPATLMTIGLYNEPAGVFLPSILY